MADEKQAGDGGTAPAGAGKAAGEAGASSNPLKAFPLFVLIYVAAGLAGTAFTEVVLVPKVAGMAAKRPGAAAAAASAGEGEESKAAHAGEIYTIDDLVINPADSGGMRYLAASVGLQSSKVGFADAMKAHDAPIKDALIRVLGSKTIEELADVQAREKVRDEIKQEIASLVPDEKVDAVYFLSFVLQ